MSAKEFREKTVAELEETLLVLRREQLNLRLQRGLRQAIKPHLFQRVRRDIARLKTVLREKKGEEA